MVLPTLYKRTKTGAIQQWLIYMGTLPGEYITSSGQLGGVQTDHVKNAHPKNVGKANYTTHDVQAELEMQSEWKAKHDEGYKSLEDLGITSIISSKENSWIEYKGKEYTDLGSLLELVLPKFNTDASGRVKPMLATDAGKIKKIEYPVFLDYKYNGVRSLTTVYPGGTSLITSRSGKEYTTLPHIQDLLARWAQAVCLLAPITFDGEIYSHGLTLQEIASAVKRLQPNSYKLQIRVYDIIGPESQIPRDEIMRDHIKNIQEVTQEFLAITAAPRRVANNWQEVKDFHDEAVGDGYEGAMIRLMHGKYSPGQRSRELIKVKEFDSTEFELCYIGVGERDEDLVAHCKTKDGKSFKAKLVGNRAEKKAIVDEYGLGQDIVDKVLTVKHFGYTPDGIPFHPVGEVIRDYE